MKVHLADIPGEKHHLSLLPFSQALNEGASGIAQLEDKNIIVCAHLLGKNRPPSDYIMYQCEQIGEGFGANPEYIELLRQYEVWDYSKNNIAALAAKGIAAKFCPVGYSPCLTKPSLDAGTNNVEQDIDVLFYGSMNERRRKVLEQIHEKCNLVVAFNVYTEERDKLIARSKVVLNMHYYERAIHQMFRTQYLMANKKCVVTEIGKDVWVESPYYGAMDFVPYDELVDECLYYVNDADARRKQAEKGFEVFSKRLQSDMLKALL